MNSITDSMDISLSKLQELVMDRAGVLQSMGSQRVRNDWATELIIFLLLFRDKFSKMID